MRQTTEAFRSRYRAAIHPRYNPWLHGAFVLLFGVLAIGAFWSSVHQVRPLEWLTVPLTLLFFNFGVYMVHRHLGHHKKRFARMFYARHAGDHHSFFTPGHMTYDGPRDWRVILFPAWLIVLHTLAITLPLWWLFAQVNSNVAGLFGGCMVFGYLTYEVFHACEHLPPQNPLTRLPWIRQMRRLHELHHRREHMQERNFNIVFPLMDYLFGTLYREPETAPLTDSRTPMTRMQHTVDIAGDPIAVLAYAATVSRWPEWHPSSLKIDGPSGALHAGARFDEDIHAGGREGHLRWEVTEYLPGRRWCARAQGDQGLSLLLTYECSAQNDATRFVRTLDYQFEGIGLRIANHLLLKRRIDRESAASMLALRDMATRHLALAGAHV
ncbi:sterol desaturase family protein [Pseudomonas fluorescens]|uniref:Putative membrane protein n=1 Tax=Pseudomonas fluorescens (strain Pf0-1) TaxID=205922 RepID=Q3KBI7_PSEPF|nr:MULTISPECIES: sterol desaturase family protein [Pseudomonas]ABA74867.1 putative membrane protein [Pseudomonas fluorescens Pf0-1]MBY9024916.1 sterol desaturase family protein [Pseudomonas fluorescens]MBY9029973.1 sterol desaturase family protein [Pseudomonas fluorescens]MBY9036573.1 sterol desaturase family protein [Pseudomonas fluorescens]MBY9042679.1 sterol desaturase family protein [Pseudomonas fluorescens]